MNKQIINITLIAALLIAVTGCSKKSGNTNTPTPVIENANGDGFKNPFVTQIYTADPSTHVWADGRLYVYPSHDVDPPRGCDLMDKYHVYSTDDMVTWRDEGQILQASDVAWGRAEGGFMWAPDC